MKSSSVEGKYLPLQKYLTNVSASRVTLTFEKIETVLNAPLPYSAYHYPAWWGNNEKGHLHALAWLETGYVVENVQIGKSVEFVKKNNVNLHAVNNKHKDTMDGLSMEEVVYMKILSEKMESINAFFTDGKTENSGKCVIEQYNIVKDFRRLIGNIDNDVSFIGCLLIKEFFHRRHSFAELNMALKPQGSPGLDVDEEIVEGKRVIGELKTTYPYQDNDLGGSQRSNFIRNFEKLHDNVADYKYFFVTEPKTFEVVRDKYSQYLQGINLVLLPQAITDSEFVITYT